jgi:hypothetical protein
VSRSINIIDVVDCESTFGDKLSKKLHKDMTDGLSLWQACAMIEQCWSYFGKKNKLDNFRTWFFSRFA